MGSGDYNTYRLVCDDYNADKWEVVITMLIGRGVVISMLIGGDMMITMLLGGGL